MLLNFSSKLIKLYKKMNIDDEMDNDFSGQGNLMNYEDEIQVKIKDNLII